MILIIVDFMIILVRFFQHISNVSLNGNNISILSYISRDCKQTFGPEFLLLFDGGSSRFCKVDVILPKFVIRLAVFKCGLFHNYLILS